MKRTLTVLGLMLLGLVHTSAQAGPYSGLAVFGDSLSDVGNVQAITTSLAPAVSPTPGPYYYQGRFSNGPNYVDALASGLGLGPVVPSVAGGTDYAYGDAMTTGTPFPENVVVQDLDKQVSQYLASHTPSASALYDVYAGANDVIAQLTSPMPNAAPAAANIAADVNSLYAAGARQFLVPNLPLLGTVPEFNSSPAASAGASALSVQFDTALAADLSALQLSDPGIVIHQLDVATLFAMLEADPSSFGLMNVTDSAAPGLEPGDPTYDTSQIVSNPNQYLFWDEIHPTTAGHALLGEAALEAVVPEPGTAGIIAMGAALMMERRRRY